MASSSSSSSSSILVGVCFPVYELAPGQILKAVEHASALATKYSVDGGEFYSMAMAEPLVAAKVSAGAILVLPLSEPEDVQRIEFADVPPVIRQPQPRMICGCEKCSFGCCSGGAWTRCGCTGRECQARVRAPAGYGG
jgi:hypothetical protein